MRNWILHIIYIGIWAAFAVSCSSVLEDEIPNIDCPTDKDERVNLTFTLVLGEQSSASRAAWSDDYENLVGSVAENTINSLQVLLFSKDGNTCYGPLEQTEFFPINQEKSIYEFTGSIPLNAENACIENDILNCKIMVLANSQVQIANAATADRIKAALEACEYTYSTLSPNPMWGVSTIRNQPVIKGWGTELDPIYVLRSLAKIEVNLSQSLKDAGYTLDAVTLTKHNTKGYCLPNGYYTTTIDGQTIIAEKTKDLNQEGVLHAYNSSVTTNELSFTGSSNNGYIVYVPEYEMQGSEDPTIKLSLKKGTETIQIDKADPVLYFKNYDETTGKPTSDIFNIVRNHWYKYLITGIKNGLDLTVKAMPWTLQPISMSFNDIVTYNVTGWMPGTYNAIDNNDHLLYMTQGKNAEFIFDIVTPEDCEYQIGLTNNLDFSLTTETQIDGSIKVIIQALDTTAERPKAALYVYAKDKYGRNVELDLTGTGTGNQSTEDQESVNRYTIIQNW